MYDRNRIPDPLPRGSGAEARFKESIRRRCGLEAVTSEMWREVIAVYYGMVSRLDSQIGRISEALEQSGQVEQTVTFFFADHGEYLGDFGLIEKWPSGMDRCITADPLILSGGGLPAGQRCSSMVELIDILPHRPRSRGCLRTSQALRSESGAAHREPGARAPSLRLHRGGALGSGRVTAERPLLFLMTSKARSNTRNPDRSVGRLQSRRSAGQTYVWRL